MIATASLAACGRATNLNPTPAGAPHCPLSSGSPVSLDDIFPSPVFSNLDKAALQKKFDPTPQLATLHQAYFTQAGQQVQAGNTIRSIPNTGIKNSSALPTTPAV